MTKRKHRPVIAYSADLETTTKEDDCRVWVWGISVIGSDDTFEWGKDVASLCERLSFDESNNIVYFHNLKFDGRFIIDYLLNQGYRHVDDTPTAGEFTTLISNMGMFYTITVKWTDGTKTEFRDSLKKLPFSVAEVARAFDQDQGKGEIDYHKDRPIGYEPTADEIEYLRLDVLIIARALAEQFDEGMKALTVGSDALKEYKSLVFSKTFRKQFPVLDIDTDTEVRRAYRGGYTYADERHLQRETRSGIVLDVNSLYPSVMMNRILPFGKPLRRRGLPETSEDYPLSIFTVTFTAKLKPKHLPCIQIKNASQFSPTEYLREIVEPTTLTVTNVDWELYNEHYDIEVLSYDNGFVFQARKGMFDTYINKWMNVKENSDGGRRTIAKLHLNSLYGKLATNPTVQSKHPVLEDGLVKLKLSPAEIRDPVYTPAGVFITAWARDLTIRAAQANYDTFAYADTDSLHLLRDDIPDGIDVHPTRIGAWDHEYSFRRAFYIRAKAYLEEKHDGTKVNRVAGMPTDVSRKLDIDTIHDGQIVDGKKVPKVVPGGVVLVDTPYRVKF